MRSCPFAILVVWDVRRDLGLPPTQDEECQCNHPSWVRKSVVSTNLQNNTSRILCSQKVCAHLLRTNEHFVDKEGQQNVSSESFCRPWEPEMSTFSFLGPSFFRFLGPRPFFIFMSRTTGTVHSHRLAMASDELLSLSTLPAYVEALALFPSHSVLHASEIAGGNLNFSFRLSRQDPPLRERGAVFVKQTPPYVKVLGPQAPISNRRLLTERAAYLEWAAVDSAVAFIPQILHFDDQRMVLVLEFLDSHELVPLPPPTRCRSSHPFPPHLSKFPPYLSPSDHTIPPCPPTAHLLPSVTIPPTLHHRASRLPPPRLQCPARSFTTTFSLPALPSTSSSPRRPLALLSQSPAPSAASSATCTPPLIQAP